MPVVARSSTTAAQRPCGHRAPERTARTDLRLERHQQHAAAGTCRARRRRAPSRSPVARRLDLRFRDFLIVVLIVKRRTLFPDNWIYVHSPDGPGRPHPELQELEPAHGAGSRRSTSLGLEYFCTADDDLWGRTDAELVALAAQELAQLGPGADRRRSSTACVIRQPKAYPVYDDDVPDAGRCGFGLAWTRFTNLQTHRAQRHAPVQQPGPLDAHRHAGGRATSSAPHHDLWDVNTERSYYEEQQLPRQKAAV